MFHKDEYYVYQGDSIKEKDLILDGMKMGWSIVKSIYDHRLGKEIKKDDYIKFGWVAFWVKEVSSWVHNDHNSDIMNPDSSI